MNYKVSWHEGALEDLKRIDKKEAENIFEKVETYLSQKPFQIGKPLKAHLKGFYRYRIGKYRVVYSIKESDLLIFVLRVGKRDTIYKKGIP